MPDIVSGLLVAAACASWRDLVGLLRQLAYAPCTALTLVLAGVSKGKVAADNDAPAAPVAPLGAAAEQRMMAAAAIASLQVEQPGWRSSNGSGSGGRGGGGWDWPRFRATLRWSGLPAMRDAGVLAQVMSIGGGGRGGDVVNCGSLDAEARGGTCS